MHFWWFITVPVFILLVDFIFYRGLKGFTKKLNPPAAKWIIRAHWMISAYVIGVFLYFAIMIAMENPVPRFARIYLVGINVMILFSKLIGLPFILVDDLYLLAKRLIKGKPKTEPESAHSESSMPRKEFLKKTGIIMAGIPFITLGYGMLKTAFDIEIRRVKLKIPNLPLSFKGLTIAQLSDIHSGSYLNDSTIREAVKIVNEQNTDMIFFTGDLVNEISEEAVPFIDALSGLNAPLGVYSILGNHDYGDYYYSKDQLKEKQHNKDLMRAIHKEAGWNILLNENDVIERHGDKMAILGVENWGAASRFQKYGDLDIAKQGVEDIPVKLLLSHDPSHWDAIITKDHQDIQATFSGHTHGMQFGVKLPSGFKWSPSSWMYEQWSGLYTHAQQQIYVNTGLGFIGYPGRVGIKPEITVFELN